MTMPRTRVVFALPTLHAGGAERVFTTLLRHVDTERFELRLVVFDGANAAFLDQVPKEVDVVDLAVPRVRQGLAPFVSLLHKLQPCAVLSALEHLNKALCATRPAWPKRTAHVVRATHVRQLESPTSRLAARWLYPLADGLVFQSSAMQAVFDQRLNYRHPRATVIENPVDLARVRAAVRSTAAPGTRTASGATLVAAGALEPRKGFDLLVRAMAQTDPAVRLTILGDGSERAALAGLVEQLGLSERVRLSGHQSNPYPFIARADGFVLSSRSEGFPNVVLEALACGTPVVATPVAGLETFLAGVPHCQVAREVSVDALSEALTRFVAAPRGRTPAEAVARFDAAAVARRYETYLLDVIARRRAS